MPYDLLTEMTESNEYKYSQDNKNEIKCLWKQFGEYFDLFTV